jgi:NDP-sugar pyrophosphorylase family protein
MDIIIPMTGMGRRFLEAGYAEPKPLINIAGKPMIQYVVEMYPDVENILFICNNKHLKETDMRSVLKRISPAGKIIGIDKTTWDGPVPDILKIEDSIPDSKPVLVSYCDFTVEWNFKDFKHIAQKNDYDGAIIAYKGFHPHHFGPTNYGYMRVNDKNELLEIKEKEPFTPNRLEEFTAAGSYYFKNGKIMKKYLREALNKNMKTQNEF